MMTRNDLLAVPSANLKRGLLALMVLAGLAGCDSLKTITEPERIDYKSAGKVDTRRLEIPPNLTQLQRDNRYAIPAENRGTVTASGYNMQQQGGGQKVTASNVAPAAINDMRIERAGNQRWLVVKQAPDALWPLIKDFWQDSGFLINVEIPDAGVMETDWAENRLKIPQGFLRNSLGKMLDSVYDTGERDKFRTRLERGADGYTEIYISHRGAQEVLSGGGAGSGKESTTWTSRPSEPELEAQFLSLLMTRLGSEEVKTKAAVANALPMQARARLIKGADGNYVETDEGFDRAWRRVGLALDRVGFTVEDRDRSQGLYFVRYVDQDEEAKNKSAGEKGFFSRMFSWGSSDKPKAAQRYRVSVKENGTRSQVVVLNADGRPDTSSAAGKILNLLSEQLK